MYNKAKYALHYRNLNQSLQNGLVLSDVHRSLQFLARKAAKNEFEKNLFEVMINAVFGKTVENIRNRSNNKLIISWSGPYGAGAMISKLELKNCTFFNENLIAIKSNKTEIFFNQPIYVGMAFIDLSKTIYDFHYFTIFLMV